MNAGDLTVQIRVGGWIHKVPPCRIPILSGETLVAVVAEVRSGKWPVQRSVVYFEGQGSE